MQFIKLFEEYTGESHLIIVDVQRSFKKYFTDNYLRALKEYSSNFDHVYQIWDNHAQGPNVDKDYLYDDRPHVPDIDEIYDFPNEKLRIEKRYNYDVDADFYRKILDAETHRDMKEREQTSKLRRGDMFPTTEGTMLVYIGNNHVWYHVPKKLYNLFKRIRGQHITIVGGSMGECLLDVETAARAMGVTFTTNKDYVYSATHCPIK